MLTIDDLPDVKLTAQGNFRQAQPLTMNNVRKVLTHMKCVVRFNMMLAEPAFFVEDEAVPADAGGLVVETLSDILVKLDINNLGRLDAILVEIARQDPYHPMEDWMKGLEWDGVDRIGDLAASVTTDNALWAVYLENWLVQVCEGVCGWRRARKFSLPYVLVLVGGQGVGKTHWLKSLGHSWIKAEAELHLSSTAGKDHQLEVLKWPMAELAELDGIFRKSDISHMKAFISREEDSIRAPYARRAVIRARMTTFCGSVNDAEFLTDSSGSRRFWPVLVEGISWSFAMDWAQLWAQAYAFWNEDSEFGLTAAEDAQRAAVAIETHTLLSPEAENIAAFYDAHAHLTETFVPMNRTEILKMLGYRNLSPRAVAEAGRWLVQELGKHRTLSVGKTSKKRAWMFPYNEFAADNKMWAGKPHLRPV